MSAEPVAELHIDDRPVRQAIDSMSRAFDHLGESGRKASQKIQGELETASAKGGKSIARIGGDYEAVIRKADKLAAAERRMMAEMVQSYRAVQAAVSAGLATEADAARYIGLIRERQIADLERVRLAQQRATAETKHAAAAMVAVNDNSAKFRRQNLTYQLFDIGQSGFGGISPAMIAAQQGPQIIQLYAGQGGVNAALKDTASLLGGVASRFAPVAIAAGVAALAIKGIQDEINETSKVQVEFMDVAKAVWQVSANAIEQELRPAIRAIAPEAESAWSGIRDAAAWEFNAVVRMVQWAYETIKFHVSAIPDLFIVAGEAAANGFTSAITWMVNTVLEALRNIAAAMNGFIDRNGGEVLRKNLGWDATNWVPDDLQGKTLNIGGEDALERLQKRATDYQKTIGEIIRSDPAGKLFGAISGQAGKNAVDRMAELAKKTKGAGSAAREAQREFESFVRTADRLAEKMFPGEYARKEAEELTAQLDEYGAKLTEIQRIAVEARIADQFEAARLGVRDLEKDTKNAAQTMAKDMEETFGSVLSDIFTTPMKDADEFFDRLADGFAQIGRKNLEGHFDGLFSGQPHMRPAANDNTTLYDFLTKGVEKGARAGTMEGSAGGVLAAFGGLGDLFRGTSGQMLGLGLGAAGMGYQSQSPLMGGLGGAMSGWAAGSSIASLGAAGGPIGLGLGGVAGKIGNPFTKQEKSK